MTTTTLSLTSDDEIEAAEALLVLSLAQTKARTRSSLSGHPPESIGGGLYHGWGRTKRRSVPNSEEEKDKKVGIESLSPSTPLSFSPSGGDETPPPASQPPLPPRPPTTAAKIVKKLDRHKEEMKQWVKEQQQCVLEAKSRYQMLIETNYWLRELQTKFKQTMIQKQQQQLNNNNNGSKSELNLFPVGPARLIDHHHNHRRQLDLNRSLDEEAAEWLRRRQQRSAAYAEARKRRIKLQRVKSSLKIQRLR